MGLISSLLVKLGLDSAQFETGVRKSRKSLSLLTQSVEVAARSFGIYFSARSVVDFAKSSVEAYGQQELAIKHLDSALSLLGVRARMAMPDMLAFAAEIQRQTTVADEDILAVMSLGATIGKLSGEALQRATIAAIGLSKGFGIDLEMAMRLVSKGAVGISTGLKRLGINIKECGSEQATYNLVLATGINKYKIAQSEIETQIGSLKQLKNAWSDIKELIGAEMSPAVKETTSELTKWLPRLTEIVKLTNEAEENIGLPFLTHLMQITAEMAHLKTGAAAFIETLSKTKIRPLSVFEERRRVTSAQMEKEWGLIREEKLKVQQSLISEITEQWEKAKQELEDYGLTEAQILDRQMRKTGFGLFERLRISRTYSELEGLKAAQKKKEEDLEKARDMMERLNQDAEQLRESLKTPFQKASDEIEHYLLLLKKGLISLDEYKDAITMVSKGLAETKSSRIREAMQIEPAYVNIPAMSMGATQHPELGKLDKISDRIDISNKSLKIIEQKFMGLN